jgi:flagellar P-ring protein precursor FlgI
MKTYLKILLIFTTFCLFYESGIAARVKDIATIQGAGSVQAIGYGLVTGLNQTGDNPQASFTVQSVVNMLKRFGLTPPSINPRTRNVAAVMVTANIPAFAAAGTKVDVQVSSIGDASSLQGGVLLMTPLSLSTGEIIGMAQGPLSVGGYDYNAFGSRLGKNVTTSGRVPNGLILEKNINSNFINNNSIIVTLREPDFTTAQRIADAINVSPGLNGTATPVDAGSVQVQLPVGLTQAQIFGFIAQIEGLNVTADPVARVVINERTGTVVVGGNVQLLPAVVAHSGLEIQIQKQVLVPQPAPFTIRPPQIAETAEIKTEEEMRAATALVVRGATVQDIADALNLLQVKPRDLIAIFQALKEAGSLQGELIIQ